MLLKQTSYLFHTLPELLVQSHRVCRKPSAPCMNRIDLFMQACFVLILVQSSREYPYLNLLSLWMCVNGMSQDPSASPGDVTTRGVVVVVWEGGAATAAAAAAAAAAASSASRAARSAAIWACRRSRTLFRCFLYHLSM